MMSGLRCQNLSHTQNKPSCTLPLSQYPVLLLTPSYFFHAAKMAAQQTQQLVTMEVDGWTHDEEPSSEVFAVVPSCSVSGGDTNNDITSLTDDETDDMFSVLTELLLLFCLQQRCSARNLVQ